MVEFAEVNTPRYPYSYITSSISGENLLAETAGKLRAKIAPLRFNLAAEKIVAELGIKTGQTVLEIGSGLGLLGKAIKKIAGAQLNYVGIDFVFDSVEKSKGSITALQANTVNLPFADSSLDRVISADVLEHVKDAANAVKEILKPQGKAFVVIADPSEGRFTNVSDHINRTKDESNVAYWENLFKESGFTVLSENSAKYRRRDWRKIFNLPILVRLKDRPLFSCAFNPINRPGTYVLDRS